METTLYPMLKEIKPQEYVDFVCALATPTHTNVTTGESSLCAIDSTNWTILLEDPLVVPVFEQGSGPNAISPDKVGHPKGSRIFIILDIVSAFPMWRKRHHQDYKVVRNDGPWVIAAGEEGIETIRITAYMTNLAPKTFTVDIHSA